MSRTVGNVLHSPTFLVANSAEELHKLMLQNNLKWNQEFQYQNFYVHKNKHYVWYFFDHKLLKMSGESESE